MHLYTIIKAETGIKHKSTLKRTPCFGGIGKTWGKQKQHKTPQNTTLRRGFPGGSEVKTPPANAGVMGSIPGLGRSHMPSNS